MEDKLKITYRMSRKPRSAKASVANNFCLGRVQFAGSISDADKRSSTNGESGELQQELLSHPQKTQNQSEISVLNRLFAGCGW